MRVILSIFITLIVLIRLFGGGALYQYEAYQIRHEIKQKIKKGIPKEELHRFELSQEEFENLYWEKKDKEFRINGEFYDVVYKQLTENTIIIHAVSDEEESTLFAQLGNLAKVEWDASSSSSSPSIPLIEILQIPFIVADEDFSTELVQANPTHNLQWINHYSFALKMNEIEPPEVG